ncbi:MFS transporter [Nocardioides sp. dk4132]|uniref:MFS transporter n=1 Tax=unclassified Nocardioides TaxID=2615069 RepID=UPI0012969D30|nr:MULTISPECIES: MFS transporter [unclassified Nocardioides]MQW74801.1 MFS transporter [Nocardioides sp. dk4132]QGA06693.1 MFS transporter [Nocardioides sp. dk884]
MYVSLRQVPAAPATGAAPAGAPGRRVAPVVLTLGFVSLLTDISSESVAAILPLYLTVGLGVSTLAYGLIDALYQGVSALVRIAGGWGADRSGHPKWVALAGYALSCVARVGFLLSTGVGAIAAVVAADRVGKGIRSAPRDAIISAATAPQHTAYAFGVHRCLDTVGAVIGPLLAFAILWWIPDGYLTVMVVSLGFALLGVVLLGLFVEDRPASATTPGAVAPVGPRPRWRDLAAPGMVRLLVVAGMLGLLSVGDGFVYLALLERGGFAAHWFPLLYVGTSLAYLLLALPLGRVADGCGRARTMVLGHLALLAAYVAAAAPLAPAVGTLVALALLGLFYAATDGVLAAIAGRVVEPALRASGIASAQTVVALARMASSAGFGLLWFWVGPGTALLVVAGALSVVVVPALVVLAPLDRTEAAR